MHPTVRDAAFDVLREHGLTTLFANPGSTEISLLADLPSDLRFVLALHESSVVGMATGWALGRREPALAILHTTPGLGNAVSALATARVNRAPLVVVVGQQDRRHLAAEPFLAGKLQGLAGEYPVWVDQPARAQGVPGAIARAYHEALTGRGPALVIVPMDDWEAEAAPPEERAGPPARDPRPGSGRRGRVRARGAARRRRAARARRRRRRGRRRSLGGARRARGAARLPRLAGVLQRPRRVPAGSPPVRRSSSGRPAAPAGGPRAPRRRAGGRCAGLPPVRLRTGSVHRGGHARGHGQPGRGGGASQRRRPRRAGTPAAVCGEVARVVRARDNEPPGSFAPPPPAPPAAGEPLRAGHVFAAFAERLPRDAVVFEESPSNRPELLARLPARQPLGSLSPAMGGLGFALPAATGVRLACPDRPVVAFVGDGSPSTRSRRCGARRATALARSS